MMDYSRQQAEEYVLRSKMDPSLFLFNNDYSNPLLIIAARTNRGNIYTLKIELCDFPCNIPRVYTSRMLYDFNGDALDSPSSAMHTLGTIDGGTQICHYGQLSWTSAVSLYKVYIKCRLWLEMYEMHLETGNNIDYYLSHQS